MEEEKINTEETQPLTDTEIYGYMQFVQSLYNEASKLNYIGAYTPSLTNQRLGEIGLNSLQLDSGELKRALKNPIANQNLLASYGEFLKLTDMVAKRTISYFGNLPAFDYTVHCMNLQDYSELDSAEYKKDEAIVRQFLEKFNPKSQFSKICRRIMTIDTYYGMLRTDGKYNYGFQELPYEYCRITGENLDWGMQFDFNMDWFNKMGLSIKQYPPIFQEMYDRVMKGSDTEYNPANKMKRRKGTFALWSQTSSLPSKGNFVCFKFDSDIYATVPFLTAMFEDSVNKPLVRELQKNQYIIASQKILIGLIPMLTQQKSGQKSDTIAISSELLGRFLGLLKQGLSDAIKIGGVPFTDVKQVEFNLPNQNMFNESNKIESNSSGATSGLIYDNGNPSATTVKLSSEIDEFIALSVYPQFERWLSSQINWYTEKYKFKVKFEGSNFKEDRESRFSQVLKLADKGIVLFDKIASSMGMNEYQLMQSMAKSKASNFKDFLFLLPNANTKDYGEIGRPQVELPSNSTDSNLNREI